MAVFMASNARVFPPRETARARREAAYLRLVRPTSFCCAPPIPTATGSNSACRSPPRRRATGCRRGCSISSSPAPRARRARRSAHGLPTQRPRVPFNRHLPGRREPARPSLLRSPRLGSHSRLGGPFRRRLHSAIVGSRPPWPGNDLFIFINDCDGDWVEISAEIERVEPDREAGIWPHEERTLNSWGRAPLRS
jgi:hypothetical protein